MTQSWIETRNGTAPIQRGGWLDALRFIVACLIIVHHFELAAPIPLAEFHEVFARGYLLTNFFLIDSGYVLARVYGERVAAGGMSAGDFFRKRFLRVVPAHLIIISLLVGFVVVAGLLGFSPRNPEWFDWGQLPAQVLLVQSYGVPGGVGWNAPTWSISALLGCYLAFPLLIRAGLRLGPWTALLAGIAFFALAHLLTLTLLGHPVYQMPLKHGIFRALPLFALGVALAVFASRVWINPRLAVWTLAGSALALAALQVFGRFSLPSHALICLIILAAGAIPVMKRSKWVEQAALVSFSMFISNEVVRIVYFGVVNAAETRLGLSEPVQWALWAVSMPLAVAFAVAFHFWLDMPLQRRLQADKRRPDLSRALRRPEAASVPAL